MRRDVWRQHLLGDVDGEGGSVGEVKPLCDITSLPEQHALHISVSCFFQT